ncbi:hypothetical protein Bca101_020807 [Brassica carinata]
MRSQRWDGDMREDRLVRTAPVRLREMKMLSSSLSYDLIYKVSSFSDDVLSSADVKEFRFAPVDEPTGPGRLCASVTYRCSSLLQGQSVEGIGTSFHGRAGRPHSWTSGFHRPPGHYATQNHSFSPGLHDGFGGDSHQLSPPFSPFVTIPSSATFDRDPLAPFSQEAPDAALRCRTLFLGLLCTRVPEAETLLLDSSTNTLPTWLFMLLTFFKVSCLVQVFSIASPDVVCFHLTKDSKYDSGRFSGLLSSSGSPRFGFSRRPSRLSSADNLDDPDCSCPFDFDDVDESGLHYSLDRKKTSSSISQLLPIARKSQDAAVGVLVQMLKTAPPLRLDSRTYMASMSDAQREGSVSVKESEFSMVRSTTDALEELRNYKQLKDLLLSKSKSVTPVH